MSWTTVLAAGRPATAGEPRETDKIEITPSMIAAGVERLDTLTGNASSSQLVEGVYLAMKGALIKENMATMIRKETDPGF